MVLLPQPTKKLYRCSEILENHGSLLEDTTLIILFNLIGERYKMAILFLLPYPLPHGPVTIHASSPAASSADVHYGLRILRRRKSGIWFSCISMSTRWAILDDTHRPTAPLVGCVSPLKSR